MNWVSAMQLLVGGFAVFGLGLFLGALWGLWIADRIVAEEFERR